jgi:hypothetical protein
VASVGLLFAPVVAFGCGLVIALGNGLSAGLPPLYSAFKRRSSPDSAQRAVIDRLEHAWRGIAVPALVHHAAPDIRTG